MRNKRGWIFILEATIAVLIVTGVMVTIYSGQSSREEFVLGDFIYSLQSEVLDSIALNGDLRTEALLVVTDQLGDAYYEKLDSVVAAEIPASFGYLLRVCNLSNSEGSCNMPSVIFTATLSKNIFVREAVVSSEVGGGSVPYAPKRLRLFVWEGNLNLPEGECVDGCSIADTYCSLDFGGILSVACEDINGNGCLDRTIVKTACDSGYICDSDSVDCVCANECSGPVSRCSDNVALTIDCELDGACWRFGERTAEDCGDAGCDGDVCADNSIS